MILDERVSFYSEEDASEFINFLKDEGCKAQKQTYTSGEAEEGLTGSIRDIAGWLEKPETSEYYPSEYDWENAKRQLRNMKENLNKITKGHKTGDVLFTRENLEESKELFLKYYSRKIDEFIEKSSSELKECEEKLSAFSNSGENPGKKENDGEDISKYSDAAELPDHEKTTDSKPAEDPADDIEIPEFPYYNMLIEQNFVEESRDGFVTSKNFDEGDLRINLTLNNVELPEDFRADGIIKQTHYELSTKYVVKIDPSVHLYCDSNEVMDKIYDLDYDEDEAMQLFKNLIIKKPIIYRLLEIVSGKNGISTTELTKSINEAAIRDKNENSGYDITLDENTVSMIVSELRKTGILSGNDKKIRFTEKKKKRQR